MSKNGPKSGKLFGANVRFLDAGVALADTRVLAGPPDHMIEMLGCYVMVKQAVHG